jgi:hypothetical protein
MHEDVEMRAAPRLVRVPNPYGSEGLAEAPPSPMSDEIPTVPPGSIETEQDGDDLFLLLHGKRIAKRGRHGTRKAKKWIPIVSWIHSVVDESDSSVVIQYARDKVGRA